MKRLADCGVVAVIRAQKEEQLEGIVGALVEVGCEERPGEAGPVFYVRDNGIGFDEKYVHRIFDVFQKLHRADEFEGTGIGLAIVKKIVDIHQGYITAKGAPGKGAQFDIYLPHI